MRKILLYCFILLCSLNVLAGKRIIKGQVLGEDGYPISGAIVIEKETNSGVGTDIDGKFKIRIKNKNSKVIEVISLEHQAQEVKLDKEVEFYTITLLDLLPKVENIIIMGTEPIRKISRAKVNRKTTTLKEEENKEVVETVVF